MQALHQPAAQGREPKGGNQERQHKHGDAAYCLPGQQAEDRQQGQAHTSHNTGIDIPEIVNLVFFKKVRSYAKFWQMIGRGTRLCANLFGQGVDKDRFLIFDFCNNFEYFRVNKNGSESGIQQSLCEKTYNIKAQIIRELQASEYSNDEGYIKQRVDLVDSLHNIVIEFNDDSFMTKRHLRYVEKFRDMSSWKRLETIELSEIKEHIAPLTVPAKEDELARRFDYLMYSIMLGMLQQKNVKTPINIVITTAEILSRIDGIPQIELNRDTINRVQTKEFWDNTNIIELDAVRDALRDLLQYIEKGRTKIYYTDFDDSIIDVTEGQALTGSADFQNYKKKVEFYLKQHMDNIAVYKLRNNKKLTASDIKELESILWKELGSRDDYIKEYGDTPIGALVRKIVGVDRAAVNEAFSEFISDQRLNVNQIRFVNLIIDYIVANGNIDDNRVLMEEPFKSVGSITALFKNNMDVARHIMDVVALIKNNSEYTA